MWIVADGCTVKQGDRIAQLILERIVLAPILEVDVSAPTERQELLRADQVGSGGYCAWLGRLWLDGRVRSLITVGY